MKSFLLGFLLLGLAALTGCSPSDPLWVNEGGPLGYADALALGYHSPKKGQVEACLSQGSYFNHHTGKCGPSERPTYRYGSHFVYAGVCESPSVASRGAVASLNSRIGEWAGPPSQVAAIEGMKRSDFLWPGASFACHGKLLLKDGKTEVGTIAISESTLFKKPAQIFWASDADRSAVMEQRNKRSAELIHRTEQYQACIQEAEGPMAGYAENYALGSPGADAMPASVWENADSIRFRAERKCAAEGFSPF